METIKSIRERIKSIRKFNFGETNIGEIIQGTGGLRKMRFAIGNRGKSHSIRILYIDFSYYEKTYFLFAYPKNELENITDKQKQIFKTMINILLEELRS